VNNSKYARTLAMGLAVASVRLLPSATPRLRFRSPTTFFRFASIYSKLARQL
jgi:hypothetical protein